MCSGATKGKKSTGHGSLSPGGQRLMHKRRSMSAGLLLSCRRSSISIASARAAFDDCLLCSSSCTASRSLAPTLAPPFFFEP